MNLDERDTCPACGITWIGEPIPEEYRNDHGGKTNYKANIVGVEYRGTSEDYDGVSEYRCLGCEARWGAWSGKQLADGELEPRGGRL